MFYNFQAVKPSLMSTCQPANMESNCLFQSQRACQKSVYDLIWSVGSICAWMFLSFVSLVFVCFCGLWTSLRIFMFWGRQAWLFWEEVPELLGWSASHCLYILLTLAFTCLNNLWDLMKKIVYMFLCTKRTLPASFIL